MPANAQRGADRPANVFVEQVIQRDFSIRVEALGTLEPNEKVDLTLNAADRVTALYFDDGQRIKMGKTLLSLAQREQIALVEAAEATLSEAENKLNRANRLYEENATSLSEVDRARRDRDNASAQLRAVQSRQKDRVLVAPFDGVLGFRQVSIGSYVRPGDVVATLIDDSEMNLEFSVPSIFLRSLKQGTSIEATTSDLPGEIFTGSIAAIDNAIDPITRSLKIRAKLPNPDQILKSGMFMQVTLFAEPRTSPSIPEESVQPIGPETFVFIIADEDGEKIARRQKVELGARFDKYIEIVSGLNEGDLVVTEGIIGIKEGKKVQIRSATDVLPKSEDSNKITASNSIHSVR